MAKKKKKRRFLNNKIVLGVLCVLFVIWYMNLDRIKEHKVTQAKIEMIKRMMDSEPNQWGNEFMEVYDSLIVNKIDTTKTN